MKQIVKNTFNYFRNIQHACISSCVKYGRMLEQRFHDYSADAHSCNKDREKRDIRLSRGFVYLIGLVLFAVVFGGIVVFGSGYVAGDSSVDATGMDFDSSCLWLNGNGYDSELSPDSSPVAGTGAIPTLDLANTLSDGEITCLRPFRSYKELKQFLDEDLTDEHIYSKSFDCDDFAFMLSQNALNKGYQIFPFAEGNHLKNVAHVALGDTIIVYVVEPQTDELSIWGKVD